MRKHFLLLFLMTLIPFYGWAADLSEIGATLIAPSYTYGTNHNVRVVINAVELHKRGAEPAETDEFYVKGYYEDNNGAKGAEIANFTPSTASIGKYWVVVEGVNDYEGELEASFLVDPAPLYIDIDGVAKTYGDNPTTNYTFKVYSVDQVDANKEITGAAKTALGIQVFVKDGNDSQFTPAKSTDAGSYNFGFTPTKTGNYTLVRMTNDNDQYVVNPKSINDLTINIGETVSFPYTGENIATPAFTVKDGNTSVTTYTVKWFDAPLVADDPDTEEDEATSDDAAVTPVNAGTYYARLTASGNYSGTKIDNENYKITVTRLPLSILVNPQSKTYNGVYYTQNDVQYTIGGLVSNDQGQVNKATLDAILKVDGNAWANFKNYKEDGYVVSLGEITDAVTIKQGENNIPLSTNYNPITTTYSVWTINKAPLTLTAAPQEIAFDAAIPASTVTATTSTALATALAAEMEAIATHFKAPAAAGAKNDQYGTQEDIYTPTQKIAADYEEEGEAQVIAANALLANYVEPTLEAGTIVTGSLSVLGGAFTIMPIIATSEYDGLAHNVTGWSATATVNAQVYQLKADEVANVAYEYTKLEGSNWVPVEDPTTIKEPGTYRVKVADGVEGAEGSSFESAVVTNPEVQFQILKKKLTMTVHNVTLWNKATSEDLQAKGKVDDYAAQMVDKETISFKYVFIEKEQYNIAEDAETGVQTITFGESENIAGAIGIELNDDEADNAHYEFDLDAITYGNLIKMDNAPLDIDNDAAVKVADAAANSETNHVQYDVTISDRTLVANDWNVLVLPFDITPYEFCETIGGYAIFNTLKSANTTTNTVKFGLELANLPANEPFLVKPLAAVDFDEINDNDTPENDEDDYRQYVFAGKDIVSGNPIKDDVDGVKFIGTYETKKVLVAGTDETEAFGYVADGGEAGSKISFLAYPTTGKAAWYTATNSDGDQSYNWFTLAHTKAYFDFNETTLSRPTIIVEEADGSTTAISAITNEGVAVKAEGWYTIDGIKLNAAPTQKGIYINNGKKIVVK